MSSGDPPGFKRVNIYGGRISYLTIPDPSQKEQGHRSLSNITQVKDYLMERGCYGEALAEALKGFDFSKRKLPESEGQVSSRKKGELWM